MYRAQLYGMKRSIFRGEPDTLDLKHITESHHKLMLLLNETEAYIITILHCCCFEMYSVQLCSSVAALYHAVFSQFGVTQLTHPMMETMATHVCRSKMLRWNEFSDIFFGNPSDALCCDWMCVCVGHLLISAETCVCACLFSLPGEQHQSELLPSVCNHSTYVSFTFCHQCFWCRMTVMSLVLVQRGT